MRYRLGELSVELRGTGQFIAPNAAVIGNVCLEERASVWFNATVRGDLERIHIGPETNIQDNAVLHTDLGSPLTFGRGVTVGHHAMVHGCTIGDFSLIGIHAVVLNNVSIGRHCLIGANTLIPENKIIPDGSLVIGSPGKVMRMLTDAEIERLHQSATAYAERAQQYLAQLRSDD